MAEMITELGPKGCSSPAQTPEGATSLEPNLVTAPIPADVISYPGETCAGSLDTTLLITGRGVRGPNTLSYQHQHENDAFFEKITIADDAYPDSVTSRCDDDTESDDDTTECDDDDSAIGDPPVTIIPEDCFVFDIDHFSEDGDGDPPGGVSVSSTNLLQDEDATDDEPEVVVHSAPPSTHDGPEITLTGAACNICLGWEDVRPRVCCSAHVCSSCTRFHMTTQISMGVLAIECLSCDVIVPEKEVLSSLDPTITRTYNLLRKMRARALRKGLSGRDDEAGSDDDNDDDIHDDECSSSAGSELGSDVGSDNMAAWAEEEDNSTGLANARRCPECQIYIQKRAGCYNIKCPLCGVKFCYKCGERLPHDMSLHRNRNLIIHRPWIRCHGCTLCCSKLCSSLRDCCCSRRWLQVVRLSICFLLLALLAILVLHVSGIVL